MSDIPNPDGHEVQHALGLDLGKSNDPSALTVVRQLTPYSKEKKRKHPCRPGLKVTKDCGTPQYEVVWIEQFDLGTPYTEIVDRVAHVKGYPPGDTPLALDARGVGEPVVEMFRKEGVYPQKIVFTGGQEVKRDGRSFSVPKKDLATIIQTLLQTSRLKIAKELPYASTLVREMKTFRVKIGASGHARFEHATEGDTDDILMSLACAVWFLESGDTLPQTPSSRQYTDWSRMLP